jgi:hypothetical protein
MNFSYILSIESCLDNCTLTLKNGSLPEFMATRRKKTNEKLGV